MYVPHRVGSEIPISNMDGALKEKLEEDTRMLCAWKDVEILELSVQVDHVHLVCSIPPKLSVSTFMGFLKGKLANQLFKSYPKMKQNPYWGNHFWSRGYFVNTVGIDEDMIRRYVKYQEKNEKRRERERRDYNLFT